jgi:hypothetical protein
MQGMIKDKVTVKEKKINLSVTSKYGGQLQTNLQTYDSQITDRNYRK